MLINTTYARGTVGTSVYTRNLVEAFPEARAVRLPASLTGANRYAHWTKRGAEVAAATLPGAVVHPYWAVDASTRHVVSALDVVQYREATGPERRLLLRAATRSRALLTLSEDAAAAVEAETGRRADVAPPFSDPEWYVAPTTSATHDGPLRIAYWGGFHPRKGLARFLDTLGRTTLARDVTVWTTGDHVGHETVDVRSHGRLTGPNLVRLVDGCDLAVYPSAEEGWGLPVVEALLRERPMVCSPLPVYDEFATGTGLSAVSDWDDPTVLTAALERARTASGFRRDDALAVPERARSIVRLREAVTAALHA